MKISCMSVCKGNIKTEDVVERYTPLDFGFIYY